MGGAGCGEAGLEGLASRHLGQQEDGGIWPASDVSKVSDVSESGVVSKAGDSINARPSDSS